MSVQSNPEIDAPNRPLQKIIKGTSDLSWDVIQDNLKHYDKSDAPAPFMLSSSRPITYKYSHSNNYEVNIATIRKAQWRRGGIFSTAAATGNIYASPDENKVEYTFVVQAQLSWFWIIGLAIIFALGIFQYFSGGASGIFLIFIGIVLTLIYIGITISDYLDLCNLIEERLF